MALAHFVKKKIRADLDIVFAYLHTLAFGFMPSKFHERLTELIYEFYNSHGNMVISEVIEQFKTETTKTHARLLRVPGISFEEKNGFYYYDFCNNDKEKLATCVLRFYLNPKLGRFHEVIETVADTYALLPPEHKHPFSFKFLAPNMITKARLERADKAVLYFSLHNELVIPIQKMLRELPNHYFYDTIPLFTMEVRNGVGRAREPKREGVFFNLVKGLKKDDEFRFSYGSFMAHAITQSMRALIVHHGIAKDDEIVFLSEIPPKQFTQLKEKTKDSVIALANQGLHI